MCRSLFDGERVDFSPSYYLNRIVKYSGASPCCLIAGFQYLERLKEKSEPIILTTRNLQRLLLISVMTAAKFLEDQRPPLTCWCVWLSKLNLSDSDCSDCALQGRDWWAGCIGAEILGDCVSVRDEF